MMYNRGQHGLNHSVGHVKLIYLYELIVYGYNYQTGMSYINAKISKGHKLVLLLDLQCYQQKTVTARKSRKSEYMTQQTILW